MNHTSRFLLALAGAFAALPPFALGAPKVEETIVGPSDQPGYYVVSTQGAHLGFAGKKGARFVVNVDGVQGPEFDQLLRPTGENLLDANRVFIGNAAQTATGQFNEGPLLMSVDGAHYAYIGRQGDDLVVIHDGKEIGRGPRGKFAFEYGPLAISRGGKQVLWVETDAAAPQPLFRLMVTGKPGPWAASTPGTPNVVFSADDSRHAYRYVTKDKKQALAVDGKDAGYLGNNPVFTADGKLLITSGMDGKEAVIMVDGKAVAKGVRAGRIFTAPVGPRWGALVFRKDAQSNDVTALIIDGKEVAGGAETQKIWFSPDGKHYAAASHHHFNRGPDFMIVDGKRGTEFQNVTHEVEPFWSPDSSTLIYTAKSTVEPAIVVVANGKEVVSPGRLIDNTVVFSERGGHYSFSKIDPRKQNQTEHIVDGQPLPADRANAGTFRFSADGSRYGHLTAGSGMSGTLVVNGEKVPDLMTGYFAATDTATKPPAFVFSPDGKHLVAYARETNTKNLGLWLNGKVIHATQGTLAFPTFTPDGKNLFWAAEGSAGLVVYVNGQPTARTDRQFFNLMRFIWHMDANGVLSYVGADGGVVKRYRITAAPDTSVATLIANGTTDLTPSKPAPVVTATPPPLPATPKPAAVAPTPARAVTVAPAPAPARTATVAPAPAPASARPPAATGPVVPLTWNDLVGRPEARPATCIVNQEHKFQSGATVRAGTKVNVLQVTPVQLTVGTTDGRTKFVVKPEETDILAVANAAWAQLTPAQRELTYTALLQRMDLWPYRVKLLASYTIQGRTTQAGDSALFLGFEGKQPLVLHEKTKFLFNVETAETDLMTQARTILASETGAPGRMLEELADKLVSPVTGQAVALDRNARPKYVLLYRGAGWCGPCQAFSPGLVNLLKEKAPTSADVALFYVSADNSPAEAKAYVTKIGIDWPTIYYKRNDQLPAFNKLIGTSIPQLVVTDRHGKVVVDSSKVGQERALAELRQLL